MAQTYPPGRSLRAVVLTTAGQDLRKCSHCSTCSGRLTPDMDLTIEGLVQLVLLNDEEALTSRTLWSDQVLEAADHACASGLNLPQMMLALRAEAARRGLQQD